MAPDQNDGDDVDLLEIARRHSSQQRSFGVRRIRRMVNSFGLRIGLVVAFIIVVGAFSKKLIVLLHPAASVPTQVQQPTPPEVSAATLSQAFKAGGAEAEAQYGNKALVIDGTVQSSDVDLGSKPILELRTGSGLAPVQATFSKDYAHRIATITPGTQVTIRCRALNEFMDAPLLSACSFLS